MTTSPARATEELRSEHAGIRHGASALARVASQLGDWSSATPGRLHEVETFLTGELAPHAKAEESVLYPLVEKAIAPGSTITMVADHDVIRERVMAVAELIAKVGEGPPTPPELEALREHLYGLWAIVCLHLDKEEKVLFSLIDAKLSAADVRTLQEELASHEAGHSH